MHFSRRPITMHEIIMGTETAISSTISSLFSILFVLINVKIRSAEVYTAAIEIDNVLAIYVQKQSRHPYTTCTKPHEKDNEKYQFPHMAF